MPNLFRCFKVIFKCILFGFPACLSDRDGHNLEREKENYPSRVTPKSGKRKWLNSSESCRFEMTDTKVPIFSWSQEDQEVPNH